jgi:hypothetical protein
VRQNQPNHHDAQPAPARPLSGLRRNNSKFFCTNELRWIVGRAPQAGQSKHSQRQKKLPRGKDCLKATDRCRGAAGWRGESFHTLPKDQARRQLDAPSSQPHCQAADCLRPPQVASGQIGQSICQRDSLSPRYRTPFASPHVLQQRTLDGIEAPLLLSLTPVAITLLLLGGGQRHSDARRISSI